MMTVALLLAAMDEKQLLEKIREAERRERAVVARVLLERTGKQREEFASWTGTVRIAGGEAHADLRSGSRESHVCRPGAGDFQALDVWALGLDGLLGRFRISRIQWPGGDDPAESVTGADGKRVPPAKARLRPGALVARGGEGAPYVLVLAPAEAPLREKVASLRLVVDPESFRVRRAVVETPQSETTCALSVFEPAVRPDEVVCGKRESEGKR